MNKTLQKLCIGECCYNQCIFQRHIEQNKESKICDEWIIIECSNPKCDIKQIHKLCFDHVSKQMINYLSKSHRAESLNPIEKEKALWTTKFRLCKDFCKCSNCNNGWFKPIETGNRNKHIIKSLKEEDPLHKVKLYNKLRASQREESLKKREELAEMEDKRNEAKLKRERQRLYKTTNKQVEKADQQNINLHILNKEYDELTKLRSVVGRADKNRIKKRLKELQIKIVEQELLFK